MCLGLPSEVLFQNEGGRLAKRHRAIRYKSVHALSQTHFGLFASIPAARSLGEERPAAKFKEHPSKKGDKSNRFKVQSGK